MCTVLDPMAKLVRGECSENPDFIAEPKPKFAIATRLQWQS